MLLRRITEHVKAQNWTAVALDFLIVVAGVFMGLQVQQWSEHRRSLQQEATYLERLKADFTNIDQQISACLRTYTDSLDAIERVTAAIESAATDAVAEPEQISDALIRITADMVPPNRSATFVEMLSAGNLNILRDQDLRNILINYDQTSQSILESWRSIRDEAIVYQRPLYESVKLKVDLTQDPYAQIVELDFEKMTRNPDFISMLNVLSGSKANNYTLCTQQKALTEAVQERLAGRK